MLNGWPWPYPFRVRNKRYPGISCAGPSEAGDTDVLRWFTVPFPGAGHKRAWILRPKTLTGATRSSVTGLWIDALASDPTRDGKALSEIDAVVSRNEVKPLAFSLRGDYGYG